ncbi:MGH1-like glycoside hydrolase domain-containing protein [Blautia sp. SC05B48]|uniref:MGH1-like glycoside hydrolase domain-containing protein n=1 Tax=Blautia sp. SC05B48 TaxID=2479767 RepID=UPI003FA43716
MLGFIPWCFELPDKGYEEAWEQIVNPEGFASPCGPTTAEQRHPRYADYECLWNGPS